MEDETNGIISFECHPDAYETGVLHFWERYKSNALMGKYNSTKEAQKFTTDVSASHSDGLLHGLFNT
jgi:quinol monooxygenase YgiN